jgi:RND family efflux transporter MFP subunit
MAWVKQLLFAVVVAVVALGAWIAYLPSARPALERVGLWGVLDTTGVLSAMERAGLGPAAPNGAGGPPGGGPPGGFGGGGAPTVSVATVVAAERTDIASAIGTGQALRSVTVTPEASGRLVEIAVRPGQMVAEGDVIARLDAAAERIAVDRAELTLDDARDAFERRQRLQGTAAANELQIREAELALRRAELELAAAELDLSRRAVLAPIAGTVGFVPVEIGDLVSTATEITRIDDRSSLLVDFLVPERYVGRLVEGTELVARPLSRNGMTLEGRVRAVDNRVEAASRSLSVQAEIANPDDSLRAGMAFSIEIAFPGQTLPGVDPLAIQWNRDGAFVWALRDGRVQRVPVRIAQRLGDLVLVEADLEPGDQVVREGVQLLRPGLEVEVRGEATAAAAAAPSDT